MTQRTAAGPVPAGPVSLALVGVHGHGRSHLHNVLRLQAQGQVRLDAVVDPRPLGDEDLHRLREQGCALEPPAAAELLATPWSVDLGDLLARQAPDVVVLCTPIHTHHDLAVRALEAGCDVLLEKPPTASLDEHRSLLATAARTGRLVQVGFQTFGSAALPALTALVAAGEIGEVTGVSAVGTWVRPLDYWTRSPWTGRRTLDGHPVVDGVLTNPLAHAVATALHLAGAHTDDDVASVELDQFRANDVEVDDTSVVRVRTTDGIPVTAGLTLCAREHDAPLVTVHGTRGTAVLDYYADAVQVRADGRVRTEHHPRTDLLADLLSARADPSAGLLSPLHGSGAFMRVLDAVRSAPDPTPIADRHLETVTDHEGTHLVVRDVEHWCRRAATEHATFTELGAPWTTPEPPVKTPPWDPQPTRGEHLELLRIHARGTEVARYVDGSGSPDFDSPRPHLHPLRTLHGVQVTDAAPADHTWHLGLNVGVQDVAGSNLWGGRTYLRPSGYTWRRDHGRIIHRRWVRREPGSVAHRLDWVGADGHVLLEEHRELSWTVLDDATWQLDLSCTLQLPPGADRPVELGSPGSHGRPLGGYGGFFLRLAPSTDVDVRTPAARGEDAVHGSVPADGARWLAWSAATERDRREYTVAVAPRNPVTATDPWFVRVASYPGIGSALAWQQPARVTSEPLHRALTWVVADGRWSDDRVDHVLGDRPSSRSSTIGTRQGRKDAG